MKIQYTKDSNGQDILCDDSGNFQVMMEWEKPYMKKCIEELNPRGKVLEIGFGFGYSAQAIVDTPGVTDYTVIECSPVVWEKFEEFKARNKGKCEINVVKGRWQDVLHTCGMFNSIFFDDYVYNPLEVYRWYKFLQLSLSNHCEIGSQIGVFAAGLADYTIEGGVIRQERFECDIPEICNYARQAYIQVITKLSEDFTFKRMIDHLPDEKHSNIIVVDDFTMPEGNVFSVLNSKFTFCPDGDWEFIVFKGTGAVVRVGSSIAVGDKVGRAMVSRRDALEIQGKCIFKRVKLITDC